MKKVYSAPEIEVLKLSLTSDVLNPSVPEGTQQETVISVDPGLDPFG